MVGRAIVGFFLLGRFGAILGGATASNSNPNYVKKIDIRITVKDPKNPVITLTFFTSPGIGESKNHPWYKEAFGKALLWHSRLGLLIKGKDSVDKLKLVK